MGFENQAGKLNIVGLEDNIKPTVTYIVGGMRTVFALSRFTVNSDNIDKIALMEIGAPHQVINAIHTLLDLSYNMGRLFTKPGISLQDVVEVVYTVLRDRYKLPIYAVKINESLYISRVYHPLVKEINQYIDEIMSFSKVPTQEEQPVDFVVPTLSNYREDGTIEEENPYSLSLVMAMKGLTAEQYSELITLVTSYVKKNNANGTRNCSLVIK